MELVGNQTIFNQLNKYKGSRVNNDGEKNYVTNEVVSNWPSFSENNIMKLDK